MQGRPGDQRLPRGRHSLTDAEVVGSQRRRLRAAARALFAERGAALTARQLVGRAQVSSSTLYRQYGSAEASLLAAFEEDAGALLARVEDGPPGAPLALPDLVGRLAGPAREPLLGLAAAVGFARVGRARWEMLERLAATLLPSGPPALRAAVAAATLRVLGAPSGAGSPGEVAALLDLLA